MSLRIDTGELISGAYVIGNTGLGVLAENIPPTGLDGPSYLYNDLTLPADNGKEIIGRITRWPTEGLLFAFEDGSVNYDGDSDYAEYSLIVDGVPSTIDIGYGPGVARIILNVGSITLNGNANIDPIAASGNLQANLVISGSISLDSFSANGLLNTLAASLSGNLDISEVLADGGVISIISILGGSVDISEFGIAGYVDCTLALNPAEFRQLYIWVNDLAKIHGLILGESLQVSQTQRIAADIVQKISGTPDNVVVTRQ